MQLNSMMREWYEEEEKTGPQKPIDKETIQYLMKSSLLSIETETKDAWKHIWSIEDGENAQQIKKQPDSFVQMTENGGSQTYNEIRYLLKRVPRWIPTSCMQLYS